MREQLDPAIEMLLHDAVRDRMYGSIEFKFEAGSLVLAKRTETIKPQSYRNSREGEDEMKTRGPHHPNR